LVPSSDDCLAADFQLVGLCGTGVDDDDDIIVDVVTVANDKEDEDSCECLALEIGREEEVEESLLDPVR
jgi:hypothetical protein